MSLSSARRRGRRDACAGFTMLEILVVVGIIVVLAGIIIVGVQHVRMKAKVERTKAIIEALKAALGAYQSEFRDFPPDGYGADGNWTGTWTGGGNAGVNCPDGVRRRGTACLVYFLTEPLNNRRYIGADTGAASASSLNTVIRRVGPFLVDDALDSTNFSRLVTGANPIAHGNHTHNPNEADVTDYRCEIIDAFGFPLHYDKVGTGGALFNRGGASPDVTLFEGNTHQTIAHPDQDLVSGEVTVRVNGTPDLAGTKRCPSESHAIVENIATCFDPRRPLYTGGNADGCVDTTGGTSGTSAPRARNVGSFDLWSHGPTWSNPRDDITNFR